MANATRVGIRPNVQTGDGKDVGKIDRSMMDPSTHGMRQSSYKRGFILPHAVGIPSSAVAQGSASKVRLSWNADQVRALPEFLEARHEPPPAGFVPPAGFAIGPCGRG